MTKAVKNDKIELFVWPWKGVVANIPIEWKNGQYVGESGSKFRDELIERGYNPVRVQPLWNYKGHTGYAVVEFTNDWIGLGDALRFEKDYGTIGQGKRDYYRDEERGDRLYCWVARDDDLYSKNAIGDYLRAGYRKEEEIQNDVASPSIQVEAQELRLKEMESTSQNTSMSEKDEMVRTFNEERQNMQKNVHIQLNKIFGERDRIKLRLEMKRNKLNEQEEELTKRQAQNENETLMLANLRNEQLHNELAIEEQRRVNKRVLKLLDDHLREKENLKRKTMELEKKLDAKQALELEIKRLTGKLKVVKHMGEGDDEDASVPEKVHAIDQEQDKEEDLDYLDALNQNLVVKERRCNDELQEARKELIIIFRDHISRAHIIVKRMRQLDSKAFIPVEKRKCLGDNVEVKAVELCTQWDGYQKEEEIKNGRLVPSMSNQVEAQDMRLKEKSISLDTLIIEKDEMVTTFTEEREKMQKNVHIHLEKIEEREMKRNKLNEQEGELTKRQAENENETLMLANLINEQLEDESSENTVIIYADYGQKKFYCVTDGRTTAPPNKTDGGVYGPEFRVIKSGDSQKIYLLEGRYIMVTSGNITDSDSLKRKIEGGAIKGERVHKILSKVEPVTDCKGKVTVAGFSSAGIGEVHSIGNCRGEMRGCVYVTGKGKKEASAKFKSLNTQKPFKDIKNDEEIFSRLRICVGYSCTRSMSSGGFMNEGLVCERSAELRDKHHHVIEVLSEHGNLSKMKLGLAYIYMTSSETTPIFINDFMEKWKKDDNVDSLWIIGKSGINIFWIFQVKNEFSAAGDDDMRAESFYRLTTEILKKVWKDYFVGHDKSLLW